MCVRVRVYPKYRGLGGCRRRVEGVSEDTNRERVPAVREEGRSSGSLEGRKEGHEGGPTRGLLLFFPTERCRNVGVE